MHEHAIRGGLTLALLALASLVGCRSNDADKVRVSCETRKAWAGEFSRDCTKCLAKASTPKCNVKCTDRDYSGKCADEHEAMRKEPTCEGVIACVKVCRVDDCSCLDRCYEGKPRCRELAGEVDACTTDVCAESCR